MNLDFFSPQSVNAAMIQIVAGVAAGNPKMKPADVAERARDLLLASMLPPGVALVQVQIDGPIHSAFAMDGMANMHGGHERDDRLTEGELAGRSAALLLNDPSVDLQFGPDGDPLEMSGENDGPGRLQDLSSALFYLLREIGRVQRSMAAADAAHADAVAVSQSAELPPAE